MKHLYKDIASARPVQNKTVILENMIQELPTTPWADVHILDWLPDDNKLPVEYGRYTTPFGETWIANTPKGICYLGIVDNDPDFVWRDFIKRFGYANPVEEKTPFQETTLHYLNYKMETPLLFHLKGTPYQTEIWRRLLRIPFGKVVSYTTLAGSREHARSAGTANGRNPVFWIIPCHRVVCSDGRFDRYAWEKEIKNGFSHGNLLITDIKMQNLNIKILFEQIKEQLKDPFFELRTLGKEAIKKRIRPVSNYKEVANKFPFISWETEDNQETIQYAFHDTGIGRLLLANTPKGLCFLGFAGKGDTEIKADFVRRFPKQPMIEEMNELQLLAVEYCNGNHKLTIPLHLKGTGFQTSIWKKLLCIPKGNLCTYGSLADEPGAAQAVGSAVGANPVSYIVPCHRVVKSDGNIQGYHWGTDIKNNF